jgi:purine nucleosidase
LQNSFILAVKKMNIKTISIFRIASVFLAFLIFCGCNGPANVSELPKPPKVIFDTDLDSDVDDVGALAMLYNLHHAGEIELLGIVVTSDDPYAPVCAAALNTFYGLPDLRVGFLKNQPELKHHSRYTKQIAEEFPSSMNSWEDAEDAVELYRSILAQNPDESVYVVTVGHLSSLQGLLQSEPDGISKLNGKELAHRKIKEWICMGGQYPQGKEANFYRPDPGSTVYCINNWDNKITLIGWEIGNLVITGGNWLKEKLDPQHPVYRGYELYNGFAGRQSWDQLAVLQLLPHTQSFFSFINGKCIVAPDGSNTWIDDEEGKHRYTIIKAGVSAETVRHLTDSLMAGEMSVLNE